LSGKEFQEDGTATANARLARCFPGYTIVSGQ